MTDQQLFNERRCYVCLQQMPERAATWHAGLNILVCPMCHPRVDPEYRIYDRSPKGRWRRPGEVKRRLRAMRPQEMPR